MKKFFKKVSLVLAFALVLGSADHVTVAKAAETWKFQSSAETLYLGSKTAGADTYDFNFVGAPAGYTTNNTFAWVSSDSKVATVAAGGVVTAVADGKATITCRITNKTTGNLTATATANVTVRTIEHATKVEIYDAKDTLKTPISSAKLTVGETIDLNRKLTNAAGVVDAAGQATNKASTDKTAFKSSDEKIATVDASTGVVTALKAGSVTITAYTYDVTDATKTAIKTANCAVTVVADASYTVAQTAMDAFTITFQNDVTFDAKKLTVYKSFDDTEFITYVKESKQDGKEVKVTLYFAFDDEETEYRVVYDGLEQKFTASVGVAENIVIKSTSKLLSENEVFVANEKISNTESTPITFYPIDANGIDVSQKYAGVAFNLESLTDGASVDEVNKVVVVEPEIVDGTPVVITASFTVDEEKEIVINYTKTFYATKTAAQRIKGVKGAYISNTQAAKGLKANEWKDLGALTIALDDDKIGSSVNAGNRFLNVMLEDNYTNLIRSNNADEEHGYITFASANPNKLLVDATTGALKTIATGSAIPVVIYWTPDADTDAKAVAIVPVTIQAKRYVGKVTSTVDTEIISSTTVGVATDANIAKVTIKITDNYGKAYNAQKSVTAYIKEKGISNYSAEQKLVFTLDKNSKGEDINGQYVAYVDGTTIELASSTTASKKCTFTVEVDEKVYSSAGFSVKVANPTLGTTGLLVTAKDVDLSIKSNSDPLMDASSFIGVYNTKNGVKLASTVLYYPYFDNTKALAILDDVSGNGATNTAVVYFYEVLLNSNPVSELTYKTTGEVGDEGDAYFTVVSEGTQVDGKTFYVRKTLSTGNYTVKLKKASYDRANKPVVANANKSTTFAVKDESGVISCALDNDAKLTDSANDNSQAVRTLFNFKYTEGNTELDIEDLNRTVITSVSKEVGSYIYVESITVTYCPSATGTDAIKTKFDINKTFPVVKDED